MPMYDYACTTCGHRFEVRQSIKDDPLRECPECQGAVRRVIHAPSIVFKGSGFYKTDSRAAAKDKETAPGTPAATPTGDGAKAEGATPASSEAKPAAETGKAGKAAEPASASKAPATGSTSSTS
jgi:putative FmdB family regulatory protein